MSALALAGAFIIALAAGVAIALGVASLKLPRRTRHRRPDDGEGPFLFPAGFLWGAATADQQIEHQQPSDWTAFEVWSREQQQEAAAGIGGAAGAAAGAGAVEHIKGIARVPAEVAAKKSDFDRQYAEDLARASSMGHNAHRFSISWARLFPREDMTVPDAAGIDFYGRVLDELRKNGLVPFVTLFHFASPAWLWRESLGGRGIERHDAVEHFRRFVDAVVAAFGDRVGFWCTLNEPMVYAFLGYLEGLFPPLERRGRPQEVVPVVRALLRMHATAYQSIHLDAVHRGVAASVGIAQHVRAFMPWRDANILDRVTAQLIDRAFVLEFLDAMHTGRLKMSQTDVDEPIPGLAYDYVGVNHYGRAYVKTNVRKPGQFEILYHDPSEPGEEVSDLGWALDEQALTSSLARFHKRYGKPIYVLENGIADHDDDDKRRQRFIVRNAQAVWRAIEHHHADVRGYFHWSLVDNFEWAEGFDPRFGLYAVDYERDFARRARGSVDVYKQIAASNAISAQLWRRYSR